MRFKPALNATRSARVSKATQKAYLHRLTNPSRLWRGLEQTAFKVKHVHLVINILRRLPTDLGFLRDVEGNDTLMRDFVLVK